jgi:hypothetical protein
VKDVFDVGYVVSDSEREGVNGHEVYSEEMRLRR